MIKVASKRVTATWDPACEPAMKNMLTQDPWQNIKDHFIDQRWTRRKQETREKLRISTNIVRSFVTWCLLQNANIYLRIDPLHTFPMQIRSSGCSRLLVTNHSYRFKSSKQEQYVFFFSAPGSKWVFVVLSNYLHLYVPNYRNSFLFCNVFPERHD